MKLVFETDSMMRTVNETTHKIGYHCLGPIIHRWLLALDQYVQYFNRENTKFLYCARAGVRIRKLYDLYLAGLGHEIGENHEMFWISRFALCKGTFAQNPTYVAEILAREYYHQPMRDLIGGLFRSQPEFLDANKELLRASDFDAHGFNFPGWLQGPHPLVGPVKEYLNSCSSAFSAYLSTLRSDSTNLILIDSGWQGTCQSILHRAFPIYDWRGLYIGHIRGANSDPEIQDNIIGLLFEAARYDPSQPETAIILHRHLFEALLEPNGPSIEEVIGGPQNDVAVQQIADNRDEKIDRNEDEFYLLVQEYLRDHAGIGPAAIVARFEPAMSELARILSRPSPQEALAASCKLRSADFGKNLAVPVIINTTEDEDKQGVGVDQRIQKSLWPQGQIALEYTGKLCESLQDRASGLEDDASYFDPLGIKPISRAAEVDIGLPKKPVVAIVTRTKNRPVLLRRAAESVARQTYDSYVWVVVNDGGDEDVVREVILNCAVDRRKILFVSNSHSLGMEAASNVGIKSVRSDYVIIHDDDDALNPEFLERTVGFLESAGGRRYDGVVTGTEYVSEEIRDDQVIEHARFPYMDWVKNIQLSELLAQNLFAPISFIYRRAVYDAIGGYNEGLPVLGDWYFNLEFLLRSDIKVIPEVLAYYHHRDHGDSARAGVYSNSVIGGLSKHEEFAAVCRNMFMRQYAGNPLAAAAISAYFSNDIRVRLDSIAHRISKLELINNHEQKADQDAWSAAMAEIDRLWLVIHVQEFIVRTGDFNDEARAGTNYTRSVEELIEIILSRNLSVPVHPNFDEDAYLRDHTDVKTAVNSGLIASGYMHYLIFGRKEGRKRPHRQR